jgi:ATP-dependent helicase/nuclease subunit A
MDQLHRKASAIGIDELIEDILERTGFEGVLLTRPQGRRLVGNVRRVMDLARAAGADGMSLGEFVTQMSEQVLNQQRAEQACVAGEAENVIRLMTIHQAKGLEFPVVVLPDLNAGTPSPRDAILHRRGWGLTTSLLPQRRGDEQPDPLSHRLALQAEREDATDENLRRLYVAVTRHEDHLVLVGADWRGKDGRIKAGDSDLAILDGALGITAALDADRETIPYGSGEFAVRVVAQPAPSPPRRKGPASAGRKLLTECADEAAFADQLAELAATSGKLPPLLGPLPTGAGRAELAVTALSEFRRCPALYRYRYELRMPELRVETSPAASHTSPHRETGLSPMTLGTVYHRCMELLDFDSPQSPEVLTSAVAAEMELADQVDTDVLRDELSEMLDTLRNSPLLETLHGAGQTHRELDFLMDVDALRLRGQIDLLLRDAEGRWRIVDYKSDRLNPGETWADRAGKYALQLQAYALAAERHLGEPPTSAQLYSLRTGETWEMDFADLAGAADALVEVGHELTVARRAKSFQPHPGRQCEYCPYRLICSGACR